MTFKQMETVKVHKCLELMCIIIATHAAPFASFKPQPYYFSICAANSTSYLIMVDCAFPDNSNVSGFQLLAHLNDSDTGNKLYVNQTWNRQNSTIVQVEDSGVYFVFIFPIIEGSGIVYSNVEYMEYVTVDGEVSGTNLQRTTQYKTTNHQWL